MTYISKNWGFFGIFTVIMWILLATAGFLVIWISVILAGIWSYLLWRFSTIKYRANTRELEIRSGIFIKTVRRVDLSQILWESRLSVGKAVISVLHTSAGSVILFADFNIFN